MFQIPQQVRVIEHPIVLEQLSVARNKHSNQVEFRKAVFRIGRVMGLEFMRTLPIEQYEIETPLTRTRGYRVADKDKILIILVLRAAIPLVEGLYKVFPNARTGVISAWRGPAPDFKIDINYSKIPKINSDDVLIIADPMLATGNTLVEVTRKILELGRPKRLVFLTVISCEEGINRLLSNFPQAEIFTCAVDPELNSKGYIVPGLGDAGDRAFGSPSGQEHSLK